MKPYNKFLAVLLLCSPIGIADVAAETQSAKDHPMADMSMQQGQGMGMQHGQGGMPGMNMQQGQGGGMMQGMGMGQGNGGMGMMGMCMGMMANMTPEQQDQHMRMMQDFMLQMHDLSNKILAATDPKEKEQLKNKQLELMKGHMQMMMQMGSKMPMSSGQASGSGQQAHQQHQNMQKGK